MTALHFLTKKEKPLATFSLYREDVLVCMKDYDPSFDTSTLTQEQFTQIAKDILDGMTDEFTTNAKFAIQAFFDKREESLLDSDDSKPEFEVEK